ncbi:hypothetical protein FCV43_19765 [Vibrio genomosp. F6]|uniref:hypothetical protein n=1 Tax=Vibrio genomosp. F6 TaxID=723172 RepID=UPI0010BD4364|nr:hypothetical protein [Vibrio genomosp. F6]TKF14133.1 hypothetical protein FCV43_19765 [Vibrio genomosp. F6]
MKEVITIVASSSVLLGLVAYLLKSVVKQYLDRDLKVHEAQLQAKADLQLAAFKDNLERERTRIQVSYSGIFERQANVIIELYGIVLALEGRLNDGVSDPEAREEFHNLVIKMRTYYHEKRILFPEQLDILADKLLGLVINIYSESSDGKIPSDLYFALRETKDEAIREIRYLLSTNTQINS